MADSDDFGEFDDDTAFLEIATQAERHTSAPFRPSPRPPKRRRLNEHSSAAIPPRKIAQRRRAPFLDSEDEDDVDPGHVIPSVDGSDDIYDTFPVAAASRKSKGARSSTDVETGTHSTVATSASTSPANKRRRAKGKENRDADDEQDTDQPPWMKSGNKKQDRIHTPTTNLESIDLLLTQPPREHSPPWKMRGPIWQKPSGSGTTIGVHRAGLDAMKTTTLVGRQSISSRPQPPKSPVQLVSQKIVKHSPRLPPEGAPDELYDPSNDLADLPSDAFASSSSSPQKQDDLMLVSERRTRLVAPQVGLRQTTLFGRTGVDGEAPPSQANKRYNYVVDKKDEPPTHHALDTEAIKTWVYPTNLGKERDYQYSIVARGLYHNLLVALPTGLGKTFIAATIMLNYFRWTKDAKIVFVAPTKPLVTQQVEACFYIAGMPRSETVLLTGETRVPIRAEEWQSKRVFFMTPQTLLNDLKSGIADPKKIVLLVVDEAHRATGSYAYVEVVSLMRRFNPSFRVLALTATPGGDVESVQKVIDGLDISRIEIRTENSMDIREYVHQRSVEKHVFNNSDEMELVMGLWAEAVAPVLRKVSALNAYWSSDPLTLTPFGCTQARQKWYATAGRDAHQGVKGMVNAVFSILGSVSHGLVLLKYHGITPFYQKMKDFVEAQSQSKSKYMKEICEDKNFKKMMGTLQVWTSKLDFIGHPKLEYLQEAILEHFVNALEGRNTDAAPPAQTRIMVFAHYRDSAEDIVRILKRHEPMIRPSVFVGQATAKNSEGMGQKAQLDVVNKFKAGTFNTLVATSIGEEGLDIGEVDLIVCYDSKASPIRMLQRMGRTGRKREGKIILLQMRGKEEEDAAKAKDAYEKMQDLIANSTRFTFHDDVSRRIIPRDVQPVVDKRVVEIPPENSQADFLPEPRKFGGKGMKRPPKKFHMPDGVITGFVTAGRMGDEIAPKGRGKKKAVPVYPSDELIQPPALGSVILNDAELKDLDVRFQTVTDMDDDAPAIPDLDYGAFPGRQRMMRQSKRFPKPGRVTEGFVNMMRQMHAVDEERVNQLRSNLHHSDTELDLDEDFLISDSERQPSQPSRPADVDTEMWATDDPASQPDPKPKAKPGLKPTKTTPIAPKPRGRPPKDRSGKATPARVPKAKTAPGAAKPRGRPPKETPTDQQNPKVSSQSPKTPRFRISDLVDEGAASSSPPPTDPGMRFTQGVDLGSDDTLHSEGIEPTQDWRLDSDLKDFIAEDDEDVDLPDSSTESIRGFGRGTQAVVEQAKSRPRMEKIFTSDPTDEEGGGLIDSDDSSDSDVHSLREKPAARRPTYVADSVTEDEDDEPVAQQRKRNRRVILDDEDEDE